MDIDDDLPSNSKNPGKPNEETKVQAIATAKTRNPSLGQKFTRTFIKGDARTTWAYVATAVLVPRIKMLLREALVTSIDRTLDGDAARVASSAVRGASNVSRFDYTGISSKSGASTPRVSPGVVASGGFITGFEEVLIEDRGEAELIYETMYEMLKHYGVVTVADFKDMVSRSSEFTDRDWGWKSLNGSAVIPDHGGYIFKFPRPEPIKR